MFRLYEPGYAASRKMGWFGARFFLRNPQIPRTPGGRVFVIYDAS